VSQASRAMDFDALADDCWEIYRMASDVAGNAEIE
jgi:hypothetical protein